MSICKKCGDDVPIVFDHSDVCYDCWSDDVAEYVDTFDDDHLQWLAELGELMFVLAVITYMAILAVLLF